MEEWPFWGAVFFFAVLFGLHYIIYFVPPLITGVICGVAMNGLYWGLLYGFIGGVLSAVLVFSLQEMVDFDMSSYNGIWIIASMFLTGGLCWVFHRKLDNTGRFGP